MSGRLTAAAMNLPGGRTSVFTDWLEISEISPIFSGIRKTAKSKLTGSSSRVEDVLYVLSTL